MEKVSWNNWTWKIIYKISENFTKNLKSKNFEAKFWKIVQNSRKVTKNLKKIWPKFFLQSPKHLLFPHSLALSTPSLYNPCSKSFRQRHRRHFFFSFIFKCRRKKTWKEEAEKHEKVAIKRLLRLMNVMMYLREHFCLNIRTDDSYYYSCVTLETVADPGSCLWLNLAKSRSKYTRLRVLL